MTAKIRAMFLGNFPGKLAYAALGIGTVRIPTFKDMQGIKLFRRGFEDWANAAGV